MSLLRPRKIPHLESEFSSGLLRGSDETNGTLLATQINNDSFRKFTGMRSTFKPAIRATPCLLALSTKGCKSSFGTR